MFFLLSKLFYFFISPFNWLLVFILITFFTKDQQRKRRRIIFCISWFLLFSNPYIIHKLSLTWQAKQKIILTTVAFGNDKKALNNLRELARKGDGSFIHIQGRENGAEQLLNEVEMRSRKP